MTVRLGVLIVAAGLVGVLDYALVKSIVPGSGLLTAAKKVVADTNSIPKPKIARTRTDDN